MHFRPLVRMGFATFARQHKQYDLIILCHDVDRGINSNGKAASQILDHVPNQSGKGSTHFNRKSSLGPSLIKESILKLKTLILKIKVSSPIKNHTLMQIVNRQNTNIKIF